MCMYMNMCIFEEVNGLHQFVQKQQLRTTAIEHLRIACEYYHPQVIESNLQSLTGSHCRSTGMSYMSQILMNWKHNCTHISPPRLGTFACSEQSDI